MYACVLACIPDPRDPAAAPVVAFIDTVERCNEMADLMAFLHPDVTFFVRPAADAVGLKRAGKFIHEVHSSTAAPYREELTQAGPQLVIPGCERRPIENGKPAQLGLFD